MASEEEETKPDEAKVWTEEELAALEALGDRFSSLIQGKSVADIIKPEFHGSTEMFLRLAAQRIGQGQQDLLTSLLIAVAWGMFVAEQGSSKLMEGDLTLN